MLRQLIPMNTCGQTGELEKQPALGASPAVPPAPCTLSLQRAWGAAPLEGAPSPCPLQTEPVLRAASQLPPVTRGV